MYREIYLYLHPDFCAAWPNSESVPLYLVYAQKKFMAAGYMLNLPAGL
ncbi:hypothetical protein MMC2321_04826 [Chitinophaga sp. MM2321]